MTSATVPSTARERGEVQRGEGKGGGVRRGGGRVHIEGTYIQFKFFVLPIDRRAGEEK
jgi:hypothetical protein